LHGKYNEVNNGSHLLPDLKCIMKFKDIDKVAISEML
jgi:hypothetical protein